MTALNFPSGPTYGQVYQYATWDGEKWILTVGGVGIPEVPGTEASAFLARTSGLDATHTAAYTSLINGLVSDGLWSKFDMLCLYATQDTTTARLNLISSTYNNTLNNSPTFTADRGYTGVEDGLTCVITNFNPALASSPKYVLNSAHISAWNVLEVTSARGLMGEGFLNTNDTTIYPRHSGASNDCFFAVHSGYATVTNATAVGHYVANRSASNALQGYKNGASVVTSSAASNSLYNYNILVCGSATSASIHSSGYQCAAASIGSSLTSGEVTLFYNRLRTYMTAVGVP